MSDCACELERWQAVNELAVEGYEVGWEYPGQPNPVLEGEALAEMLARYGREANDWLMAPVVVARRAEVVHEGEPHGRLRVAAACWFVYGILEEEPSAGCVPIGGPLPRYGEREFDKAPQDS